MINSFAHVFTLGTVVVAVLLPTAVSSGQFREPGKPPFGHPKQDNDKVKVTVMLDTDQVEPLKTFHLVFLFDIEDTWHLYWKNPGAGAAPIEVEVEGPATFDVGEVRWPRPKVIESNVGDMYGYEKQVALFVPITPSEHFNVDAALLRYELFWAVCDDQRCLMQSKQSSITVAGSPSFSNDDSATRRQIIETHRKRLPTLADDSDDVDVTLDGSTLTITGPARGFETAALLPDNSPGIELGKPDTDIEDDRFVIAVEVIATPRNFAGTKPVAGGLIVLGEEITDPSFEFSVPLSE